MKRGILTLSDAKQHRLLAAPGSAAHANRCILRAFHDEANDRLSSLCLEDAAGCEGALETVRFFKRACSMLELTELQLFAGEVEAVLTRLLEAGPVRPDAAAALYEAFDAFAVELEGTNPALAYQAS